MASPNLKSTVALLTAAGVLIGSLYVLGMRRVGPDRSVESTPEQVVNRIAGDDGALSIPAESSTLFEMAAINPTQDKADATADFLYDNKTNRFRERMIQVTDRWGEPAVRGFTGNIDDDKRFETPLARVKWEIVWTFDEEWQWNYRHAELFDENEFFSEQYPSPTRYLDKQTQAKTAVRVKIPDTPYAIEIVNGHFAPYICDHDKYVYWRLNSPEIMKAFRNMQSVTPSSKKLSFVVGGGDVATFLIVDFSKRDDSPELQYYSEFHGP